MTTYLSKSYELIILRKKDDVEQRHLKREVNYIKIKVITFIINF